MMGQIEQSTSTQRISPIGVLVGTIAALLLLGWLLFGGTARPLKPFRPTTTPGSLTMNSQPILVTFDQLNSDPNAFRGQRIRITGSYAPQAKPDCFDFSGPVIRWALISGDLQLNGLGFEEILRLVPEGTTLTVDGIWRLYDGSVGCGKGPARGQVWYLQTDRIVQPNPLPNWGATSENGTEPDTTPLPGEPTTTPEDGSATAVPLPTSQFTPAPGPTVTPTPTATSTPNAGMVSTTPSPTSTASSDDLTRQAENSPTPTATSTTTPQPGSSATPTATATSNVPGTPGTATSTPSLLITSTPGPPPTPGGYPPPPTPSIPTPTPDPY